MPNESPQVVANQYLSQLRTPNKILSPTAVKHLAQQAIAIFFDYFQEHQTPLREAVELICEINSLPDPRLSRIGLEALFPALIERLNDSFDPSFCELYDRLFAQVISYSRQLTEGRDLDEKLNYFGLVDEISILTRKRDLNNRPLHLNVAHPIKKVLLLSRITIGADVAITSVMMSRLKEVFPQAEIVLLGPSKLNQLYGGDARVRVRPIDYGRNDDLLSRLNCWLEVVAVVQDELVGFSTQEYCIFDPDSRLTQLGLLPLLPLHIEHQSYFLFQSRSYTQSGIEKLGHLTSRWVNQVTGGSSDIFPYISLPVSHKLIGAELGRYFRSRGGQPLICLSFGIGGNEAKRISKQFEMELARTLVQRYPLFIDGGFSNTETDLSEEIISFLESQGNSVLRLDESMSLPLTHNLNSPINILAWRGGIGSFASLISGCDRYVGYDSSGQHIAAAIGIPSLTVFVNSGSPTFAKRWQPYGSAAASVLQYDAQHIFSVSSIIKNVLQEIAPT